MCPVHSAGSSTPSLTPAKPPIVLYAVWTFMSHAIKHVSHSSLKIGSLSSAHQSHMLITTASIHRSRHSHHYYRHGLSQSRLGVSSQWRREPPPNRRSSRYARGTPRSSLGARDVPRTDSLYTSHPHSFTFTKTPAPHIIMNSPQRSDGADFDRHHQTDRAHHALTHSDRECTIDPQSLMTLVFPAIIGLVSPPVLATYRR